MTDKNKITSGFWLILTIIPIIGVISSVFFPELFFGSQEWLQNWTKSYGVLAPLVLVTLQIIQVIFPPLSHYAAGFLGGFLFGPLWGAFYNWIGRLIGHAFVFSLTKRYGRPIVDRHVDQKTLAQFDKFTSGSLTPYILFMIYFLPLFPDDEISYIAGLTNIRFRVFLICNVFGHISGSLALAYLGSGIDTKDPLFWILITITILGFPILWFMARAQKNDADD